MIDELARDVRTDGCTMAEYYSAKGVPTRLMRYPLPDGRELVVERPVTLADNEPYVGRSVTFSEYLAMWNYHCDLVRSA